MIIKNQMLREFYILHHFYFKPSDMIIKPLLLAFFIFLVFSSSAQLSLLQNNQIDSLFLEWNTPNHPGGAVGIMKDGKTVFSKAYGLASLEYLVPNNNGTIFNLASVSKQFTAMGIVLLELQGKLSIEDDIRKYLPEIPDFGKPITISHMLHHTSGLRSLHALLGMAGWRADDSRSNEDIDRFMLNQKELNFTPGEEYLYCNTGYMLCVNIIEKISGQKFDEWMKENIFDPLNMPHTYVEENYSRIVADNATSYYGNKDRGFERAVEYWAYVGSGNMHSNTEDMLQWADNFSNPSKGWEKAFERLQTFDDFNNGMHNSYAFGVVIGDFEGFKKIGHGGSIGGFRSYVGAYPEEQLSIVVLTNFSSANAGGKEYQIANLLLESKDVSKISEPTTTVINGIRLSQAALEKYEGWYWNDKDNYERQIQIKNDTLRYVRSSSSETPLIPMSESTFQMDINGPKVIVEFHKEKLITEMIVVEGEINTIFTSFEKKEDSQEGLHSYSGNFYSPEIETWFQINVGDDQLIGHHVRHGDFPIKVLKKDVLEGPWPIGTIKFIRDTDSRITGIRASNGRVRNLWFKKMPNDSLK